MEIFEKKLNCSAEQDKFNMSKAKLTLRRYVENFQENSIFLFDSIFDVLQFHEVMNSQNWPRVRQYIRKYLAATMMYDDILCRYHYHYYVDVDSAIIIAINRLYVISLLLRTAKFLFLPNYLNIDRQKKGKRVSVVS